MRRCKSLYPKTRKGDISNISARFSRIKLFQESSNISIEDISHENFDIDVPLPEVNLIKVFLSNGRTYRFPSLFAGVTFLTKSQTANTKTGVLGQNKANLS